MTVENCAKLLKKYKCLMEDGKTAFEREKNKENYEMMKNHILTGKKFKGTDLRKSLEPVPRPRTSEVPVGKKSKR